MSGWSCTVPDADRDWAVDAVIVNLDHAIRRGLSRLSWKFG
jgi:hypothetical protein